MFAGELQKQKAVFASADGIALAAAFVGALAAHDPSNALAHRLLATNPWVLCIGLVLMAVVWLVVFRACDLYRMRTGGLKESVAVIRACSIAVVVALMLAFLAHVRIARLTMAIGYLLSIPAVIIGRTLTRACIRRLYANPRIAIPLVIAGFNPVGQYVLDQVLDNMTPYEPAGFLDVADVAQQYRGYPVLGNIGRLAQLSGDYPFLEIAIAMPDASREELEGIIKSCEQSRLRWWMVPWMFRALSTGVKVDLLGSIPLIGPRCTNIEGLNYALKRGFDLVAAALLLVLSAPALGLGALLVLITDGRPVMFRQVRIGIHGRRFELLKLRTMRQAASDQVHRDYVRNWIRNGHEAATNGDSSRTAVFKLANDQRITRVGRLLRRFSIDELPQLINVLRGEMSLIGPRPALPYELEHYDEWHRRRLDAAPGITGLWQVSGRNRLTFDEMVQLDVQYLEDWSLSGDFKILMRTLPALLRGEGI
ncbi:MAG TPA: exopolysaccharide biosynthesis polyprenyl glycosylphosphotransferase [Candidatus Binataceae bacterium]|nr:exopolysaccharide biosynthesis polyprenyl glycosylphosphotransferase [Candidatus Binataceae bacterium]